MRRFGCTLFVLLIAVIAYAQSAFSAYWNMQVPQPTTTVGVNFQTSGLVQGNNYGNTVFLSNASSSIGAYSGASGDFNAALACRTGVLDKEPGGSAYLSFTLTALAGFKLEIQSISMGVRSTLTGPQTIALFSNADNFATPLDTRQVVANSSWNLLQLSTAGLPAKSQLVFKVYGFNGTGTAAINIANWRLDDLQVTGTVLPENLPVQWLYFTATAKAQHVKLEWGTSTTVNNKGFTIFRSVDGTHFDSLAFVAAYSTDSDSKEQYQYVDTIPPPRSLFYSITQTDLDGGQSKSFVRFCSRSNLSILERGGVFVHAQKNWIDFYSTLSAPAILFLFSAEGKLVFRQQLNQQAMAPFRVQLPFSVSTLKTGVYFLVVQQANHRWSQQIFFTDW